MSPGSGVGPTRRANNLLLIFLPLTSAVVGSAGRGNVGEYLILTSCFENLFWCLPGSQNIQPINQSEWSHFFKPSDWLMAES